MLVTKNARLPLWLGRNLLRLDSTNALDFMEGGVQLFCLKIMPPEEGLRSHPVPYPCPCALAARREAGGGVTLDWKSSDPHGYLIRRDGLQIASIPSATGTSYADPLPPAGFHVYDLEVSDSIVCPVRSAIAGGAPDAAGFIREWLLFGPLGWPCSECGAPGEEAVRRDFIAGTWVGRPVGQLTATPVDGSGVILGLQPTEAEIRWTPRIDLNPGRPTAGTWFACRSELPGVDFMRAFGGDPGDDFVVHAVTYIENLTDAPIHVDGRLSTSDSVEMRVGGDPVFLLDILRPIEDPASAGNFIPDIVLMPGITRILVKVLVGEGPGGFWLRFEKGGQPVTEGIAVRLTPAPGKAPAAPSGLAAVAGDGRVDLDWPDSPEDGLTGYDVHRSTAAGGPYAKVAGPLGVSAFSDEGLANGTTYFYVVRARSPAGESPDSPEASATPISRPPFSPFRRGDADDNGAIDLTDSIFVLEYLFQGGPPPNCLRAADVDGNGILDLTDPVRLLGYLFLGGQPPEFPFPDCGFAKLEDRLDCIFYISCKG